MATDKRQFEAVKFTFSTDELRALGLQLAAENQAVYDLEKKKKTLDAELAADIKMANARAETTTTKLNNGYEMREVEVMVMFDEPMEGKKRILRLDTNEVIREEAMTLAEKQRDFPFKGE